MLNLDNHLEYSKYEHGNETIITAETVTVRVRQVETKYGSIEVKTPRDRNGSFAPVIIEKGQTKLNWF